MCQFCKEHGEGKIWYLQAKNYSMDLLHTKLNAEQQAIASARTRDEWIWKFLGVMSSERPKAPQSTPQAPPPRRSEAEIVYRRQVVHFGQVVPLEDVLQVFDMVDSIVRFPCYCRFHTLGKLDRRYCFGVAADPNHFWSEFPDPSLSLERLDKGEATRMLREFDREGLIHSIWTGVTPFIFGVCNCDHDCLAYGSYILNDGLPHFFRAEYIGVVDPNMCSGCKSCVKQCQFGAISYSSASSKVHINPKRCFGCGVCRAACNSDAITLIPRSTVPEAANLWLQNSPLSTSLPTG